MKIGTLATAVGLLLTGCTAAPQVTSTASSASGGVVALSTTTGGATSGGSSGATNTSGTTGSDCSSCNSGETCAAGQCQCNPVSCTGNRSCQGGRCIADPCKAGGIAQENAPCVVNADCGCPLHCKHSGGSGVLGTCQRPCQSTADCPLPDTTCQSNLCVENTCGADVGNGVVNGLCNALGQNDGTCVPRTRKAPDGTMTTRGVCVQSGCSLSACISNSDRTLSYALCAPGYACTGSGNTVGTCVQLCDQSAASACSTGQKCRGFGWIDSALSACEPILFQDAGPNCTFPNQPPTTTFTGPCASNVYQCPLGSPNAGKFYPGADPSTCGSNPGQTLSDLNLTLEGGGVMNFATTSTADSMNNFSSAPVHMHDLFCSGFKYAFIDVSAVWCPHCQDEAAQIPGLYYQSWLDAKGLVFSILVQSNTSASATRNDLANWIGTYNTPYPIVLDTAQASVTYFGLTGWPDNTIVDLSNMQVLYTGGGADPQYYQTYCTVLGITNCPMP
jgi:hypothetical protein